MLLVLSSLIHLPLTSIPSIFAGNVINLFLYGALTVQLYLYHISFPQDPWLLKTVVYLIYVIETVCTILLTYDLGSYMLFQVVESSLSVESSLFVEYTWTISLAVIPAGGGIVAFLVQATYVYRIQVLSQLRYVSWCIIALIGADLVFITVLAAFGAMAGNGPASPVPIWTSISLGIDTTIAGIMIWSLMRTKILSKQLKSKVTRLVYLTIGTGALTAAINLVTLILFAMWSDTAYAPVICLSKLYANSMMVFLNDRVMSGHDCGSQATSLETVTGALGSFRFATVPGPTDTVAQEQLASEGSDNAGISTPAIEDPL